jgi:hypothetical protein
MAPESTGDERPIEPQAGQQQVQLHIDEREMRTIYANGFRTNATAEEVMIDFGVNVSAPTGKTTPEILFQISSRVIMNYYSAKRLALTLTQLLHRHEEQFGVLELDVNRRRQQQQG